MRLDSDGDSLMFFHRWSEHASPWHALVCVILTAMFGSIASAQAEPRRAAHGVGEVDTEHIFGFTEGSDIGAVGEKELETDSTGRFGRAGGSFSNIATALEAKYTLTERFRVSAAATVASSSRRSPPDCPSNVWLIRMQTRDY